MVNFKITKKQKLLEINNDKVHNFYYLIYGKIYNEKETKYRKFKFITLFDVFDLQEFFEKDYITKNDIKEYLENIEIVELLNIKNFNDEKTLKEFYNFCNQTINDYNKIFKKY